MKKKELKLLGEIFIYGSTLLAQLISEAKVLVVQVNSSRGYDTTELFLDLAYR